MTALATLMDTQNDVPLTDEQQAILAGLMRLETQQVTTRSVGSSEHTTVTTMFRPEPDMPSVLRVLYERLVWAQLEDKLTRSFALWIGLICEDEHFTAVLWAYTIRQWCRAHPDHVVSLKSWVPTVMANGLPSMETCREVWQLQKRPDAPNQNFLDMPENWL